jgi:hypothetical protein
MNTANSGFVEVIGKAGLLATPLDASSQRPIVPMACSIESNLNLA